MKKLEDFDTIFQENGEKVKVLLKGLTFHGKIDIKKGRKRKSTNSFVTNNVSLPKSPKTLSPSVTEKIIAKHQRPSTANVRLESRWDFGGSFSNYNILFYNPRQIENLCLICKLTKLVIKMQMILFSWISKVISPDRLDWFEFPVSMMMNSFLLENLDNFVKMWFLLSTHTEPSQLISITQ